LERLAHDIYFVPKNHPTFGKLYPSLEEVAEAVTEHEHVRIRPTGAYALNKLGLSAQVPTRQVYITDGQARQIKVGKGGINFKSTTPKKFGMKGPISSLVIQALEELNLSQITPEMATRIRELLDKETPENLMEDIKLASAKVNDMLINLYFKSRKNDRMA
jgi:threonine aldolase